MVYWASPKLLREDAIGKEQEQAIKKENYLQTHLSDGRFKSRLSKEFFLNSKETNLLRKWAEGLNTLVPKEGKWMADKYIKRCWTL